MSDSVSLDSARLMRRMALRMMEPRDYDHPSERDIRDNFLAVRELVMIGVLDYVMIDLEDSLREHGMYRQRVKKAFNACSRVVRELHDGLYRVVLCNSDEARRRFNDIRDENYASLSEHVLFDGLDRPYSLACSLCRLILRINDSLKGRYDYRPIEDLRHVLREIGGFGIEDRSIDFLVDKSIVTK